MKVYKILFSIALCLAVQVGYAQVVDGAAGYFGDALLFGQRSSTYGNTARMQGFGGTQIALGADMSSTGGNPAGLGFFNRSVFSFTPAIDFHNSDATFFGNTVNNYKTNFNFSNLGVVFNSTKGDYADDKFKGGSFAISINRINNFNNEYMYQGRNPNNSITDAFVEEANMFGTDSSDPTYLIDYAFGQFVIENADGYLYQQGGDGQTYIYPDGDFNGFTSLVGQNSFDRFLPRQYERVRTSGNQYGLNFAWGGNYDDKIYFGGGLSLESIDYQRRRTYTEDSFEDPEGNPDDLLYSLRVTDVRQIDGSGVGFNGGIIIRPTSFVTLGLAYNSPTFYSIDEESEFRLSTDWNTNYTYYGGTNSSGDSTFYDLSSYDEAGPLFQSQYNLRTPGKLSLGAAFFLGKVGFLSGDVEFVDYNSSQLKSNDFSVIEDNQTIGNIYTNVINYRLGSEFRLDNFRLRAGYAFFGDPYADRADFDGTSRNISFGLGYRTRDFFLDLALVNQKSYEIYSPYFVSIDAPVVEIENRSNTFAATLGFNF